MKEKIKLILYLISILLLTNIHSIAFYVIFTSAIILSSPVFFFKSIRKILMSFILFNLIITISYSIYTYFVSKIDYRYILMINLRVFAITYLTFFFVKHTNLPLALSFSRTLSYLFTITYSQILNFIRTHRDLLAAHLSREIVREKRHLNMLIERSVNLFFTKSIYNAKETSLAMRSRGLIDD